MSNVDPKVARFARWIAAIGVVGVLAGAAVAPIWLYERETGAQLTAMALVLCFFAATLMHSWSHLYAWLVGRHSVAVRRDLQLWRSLPVAGLALAAPVLLMLGLQLRGASVGAVGVVLAGAVLAGLELVAVVTTRQLVRRVEKALATNG